MGLRLDDMPSIATKQPIPATVVIMAIDKRSLSRDTMSQAQRTKPKTKKKQQLPASHGKKKICKMGGSILTLFSPKLYYFLK